MDTTVLEKSKAKWTLSPFVIQLLLIMFLVEFVKGALLLTVLPVYLGSVLGFSAYIIGWTLSIQYLSDNLFRTPSGLFIDKFGYRGGMLLGILLTSVSVAIIAYSGNYWLIIAACSLLGIGTAPLWPAVISGTTEGREEQGKGTIMSVVYMSWLAGTGAGPIVINLFIKGQDYRLALNILLGSMILSLLVALFLPKKEQVVKVHNATTTVKPPLGERVRIYLSELKKSMNFSKFLYPALFIQTFSLGLLTPILTLYARTILNLTPNQYSLFLIVGGGVTVLTMIPIGKLVDKKGLRVILPLGIAISAVAMLSFPFIKQFTAVFILVMGLGLGYALLIPSWNALIATLVPKEKKGSIWGLFLTIEGAGTIVGPIVSGYLWEWFGYHAPFLTSGCMLVLLFVLQLFISNHHKNVLR